MKTSYYRAIPQMVVPILVAISLSSISASATAAERTVEALRLIENIDRLGPAQMTQPLRAQDTRRTFARLDLGLLRDRQNRSASTIRLDLFPDVAVIAHRSSIESQSESNFTWFGTAGRGSSDPVVLSVVDGNLAGTVIKDGKVFRIRASGEGTYEISEVDTSTLGPAHDSGYDIAHYPTRFFELPNDAFKYLTEVVTINVAVVYSGKARGADPNIQAEIKNAVDLTNWAFLASKIYIKLNLAATGLVSYSEVGGDLSTDLARFRGTSDGYMDYVHTLRNSPSWRADIVSLILDNGPTGICGRGNINDNTKNKASKAFNVVNVHCAVSSLSLAHEIGHNLGARHDWTEDTTSSHNKGFVLFKAKRRTIMAYRTMCEDFNMVCPKIVHFSNPAVMYGPTSPTGADPNSFLPADNATRLNQNRFYARDFR